MIGGPGRGIVIGRVAPAASKQPSDHPPISGLAWLLEPLERRLMLSAVVQLDAPNTNYTTSWTNSGPVPITGVNASITDSSSPNLSSLSVTLASPQPGDVLTATASGGITVTPYTTSAGAVVNAALVAGLNGPADIAVSGGYLFVTKYTAGTIGDTTPAQGRS